MDQLQESAWQAVIDKLSGSTVGITILCVIVLAAAATPLWKWMFSVYKESKKEKKKKKEKEEKESKEFKDSISAIAKHLPELDQQVSSLSNEVSSLSNEVATFRELKNDWKETSEEMKTTVMEMKTELKALSEKSSDEDLKLSEKLAETQRTVNEMASSTKKIESDMGVMFEGENNEFRLYLTVLHEKHIIQHEPMTRDEKKRLRIKFDSYEKRGGNGWAKELYMELMSLPVVESFDLPEEL